MDLDEPGSRHSFHRRPTCRLACRLACRLGGPWFCRAPLADNCRACANLLFARVAISAPFWEGSGVALLALGLAWIVARRVAAKPSVVVAEALA